MLERYRVDSRRVRLLQDGRPGPGPVLCWLSREQRVDDNWVLLHAQDMALRDQRGLIVVFCLQSDYLGATSRHFRFMLQGLQEMAERLRLLGIGFLLLSGTPGEVLPQQIARLDCHSLITDFNPLNIKQLWQRAVAAQIRVPFSEVDGHNIIPCWYVSEKQEYAAYTFRPKVNRLLPEFLCDFPEVLRHPYVAGPLPAIAEWPTVWSRFPAEADYSGEWPAAGEREGRLALARFVGERLDSYHVLRNDPLEQGQSGLSPYFHLGQLAPQRAALAVRDAAIGEESRAAFLEELIVRRELSDNFCYYCRAYDRFDGFPEWARKSLDAHREDRRTYVYSEEEFQHGRTHEPLWNCCQKMLVRSGRLHGYLRMYWAKKILEWSESPEEALRIGLLLNDSYAFDGRDPNGYAGVAWSIGGVHDRAWPERPIFGKIRYMNEKGCRRKFAVDLLLAHHDGQASGR